ncbi:MAG: hypothetical protein PUD23_10235 [Prevotella sp.]|nr:hypothetical protein [Prevotella sp.]
MKKLLSYLFALAAVAFAFTSCEDVPMPYDYPNTGNNSENVDPNAKGQSADNPYTVQEAVQLIKDGKAPTTEVYVKGIVSKLDYYNANYKSLSYYISDDGKAEDMQVYSGKGLNGADFNSKSDLKVGQTVVVKGVIKSFDKNGTTIYEVDKNSQIVSIEGEGTQEQPGDEKGQSKENPYTVKEAVDLINSGKAGSTEVYVKGIVSSVDYYNTEYKSLSYYLSDDGKTEDLQVYSGKGLNGADFNSKSDLKVGQTVIVKGTLVNYKGNTPEMAQGSKVISIEGNGSSSETPSTSKGVSIEGTTVTLTNSAATVGTATATADLSSLGFKDQEAVTSITLGDGSTVTFDANGESNSPRFSTKSKGIRVYKNNKVTFNGKSTIAKIVLECDSFQGTDYVGNKTATVTFNGSMAEYINVFTGTSGGGTQLRIKKITVYYAK